MKQSAWIFPKELHADIFQSGELHISSLLTILTGDGLIQDHSKGIDELINNPELYGDKQIKLLMPMPQGSWYLLTSKDAPVWFELFDRCLELLKRRPDARLVTGCDWDEYNIGNYFGQDLIKIILGKFRENNIPLWRMTWLHCNPMIPDWVSERLEEDDAIPHMIYHSFYLQRLNALNDRYKPHINKDNRKTHWFLSLNRRATTHRVNLAFWWFKNGRRPAHISCRLAKGDCNDVSLEKHYQGLNGYNLIREFNEESDPREEELYDQFYDSLPWSIDHQSRPNSSLWVGFQDSLPRSIVHASACYIATETQFPMAGKDMPVIPAYDGWISEKTLKSFFYGLPTIWVAPPGITESIKKLGFLSYEGLIYENYDRELSGRKRMQMIFAEIDRIQRIEDINSWYHTGVEIYEYNRARLEDLFQQRPVDLIDEFHNSMAEYA